MFKIAVVEDRDDPLKLGRVRARIVGIHTESLTDLPTENLPWSIVISPPNAKSDYLGLKPADWVIGTFVETEFYIFGIVPGIPTNTSNQSEGFNDLTKNLDSVPRPPEYNTDKQYNEKIISGVSVASSDTMNTFLNNTLGKEQDTQIRQDLTDFRSEYQTQSKNKQLKTVESIVNGNYPPKLKNFFESRPSTNPEFRSLLESNTRSQLFSFLNGKAPRAFKDGIKNLDPSNNISRAFGSSNFNILDLFDGNITQTLLSLKNLFSVENVEDIFTEEETEDLSPLQNPNELPFQLTSFGVLSENYTPNSFLYDVNRDGKFDELDTDILNQQNIVSEQDEDSDIVQKTYPKTPYPLETHLNEPTTSRLARNEKIEDTIVAQKTGTNFSSASFEPVANLASDQESVESETFEVPKTAYNAKYPFNNVKETESGHLFELDDTPDSERVHLYHRDGSFLEFHPKGDVVLDSTKKSYSVSKEGTFIGSNDNITITSEKQMLLKSEENLTLESGSTQLSTGSLTIKSSTKIDDCETSIEKVKKNKVIEVDGDLEIKVKGNFTIKVDNKFKVESGIIALDSDFYTSNRSFGQVITEAIDISNNSVNFNVSGIANLLPTFQPVLTPNQEPIPIDLPEPPEEPDPSKFKPGFEILLTDGERDAYNVGRLYKPKSDSDKKPVCLNDPSDGQISFYGATLTPEIEEVEVRYQTAMGQFTTWKIKRPVHKIGNKIEDLRYAGVANGGRSHYRASKKVEEYPTVMFVKDATKTYLLVNSRFRHD